MSKARVLLADDHKIVAEGMRSLLETDFDLLETVGDGQTLVTRAKELNPDVIVTDITMPIMNGIEAVKRLKNDGVKSAVVILTMHHDCWYARKALEIGATGFVLKHSASTELQTAINTVLAGKTYVTPLIEKELTQTYQDYAVVKQTPAKCL